MKKFNETKVGQFLGKAAPEILELVGDSIPGGGIIKALFENKANKTPEQEAEFEKLIRDYELEELKTIITDVANARDLQKTALSQEDRFSKRFIYYLTSAIFFILFVLIVLLFFVNIPDGNSEIVYMAVGMFLGIVGAVAAFFFGSSVGSKDKGDGIMSILKSR